MTQLAGEAHAGIDAELDRLRPELVGYCYRMLGSPFDAEDAVQDTLLRAWRASSRFEERAALRTWVYRIATNVCIDMLSTRARRARPIEMGPPAQAPDHPGPILPADSWIVPAPDAMVVDPQADPAAQVVQHETVRLAFVAALQHLPARQRAVLILREVLGWKAEEVAELLGTTVASVKSALQRARATVGDGELEALTSGEGGTDDPQLLQRYVEAFERYDMDALVELLHEDATLSMPPFSIWLQGPSDMARWMLGPGHGCRGSKMVPVRANGSPAFGQYRPSGPGGSFEPWALQVIELEGGRISAINSFLDTEVLFPLFGLPDFIGNDQSHDGAR